MKTGCAIEGDESGVGGVTADLEIAAVHAREGIADHADGVFGAAGHDTEADDGGEEKDGDGD